MINKSWAWFFQKSFVFMLGCKFSAKLGHHSKHFFIYFNYNNLSRTNHFRFFHRGIRSMSILRFLFTGQFYWPFTFFTTLVLVSRWQKTFCFLVSSWETTFVSQFPFIRRITKSWNISQIYKMECYAMHMAGQLFFFPCCILFCLTWIIWPRAFNKGSNSGQIKCWEKRKVIALLYLPNIIVNKYKLLFWNGSSLFFGKSFHYNSPDLI